MVFFFFVFFLTLCTARFCVVAFKNVQGVFSLFLEVDVAGQKKDVYILKVEITASGH